MDLREMECALSGYGLRQEREDGRTKALMNTLLAVNGIEPPDDDDQDPMPTRAEYEAMKRAAG